MTGVVGAKSEEVPSLKRVASRAPVVEARARARERMLDTALLIAALSGLALAGILQLVGLPGLSRSFLGGATLAVLVPSVVRVVRSLARRELGIDLIAVLAMAGALALGQALAGAVIAIMLTGGLALERFAAARARRELSALLGRMPQIAHRRAGDDIVDVEVASVQVGDQLLVSTGEVVPADGLLTTQEAMLDEAALTGEARPVQLSAGAPLRSGGTNLGAPLELRVTARPADSTYAGILRLVRAAESSKAPLERLADRFALGFLVVTLALALAAWLASADAVRALAVLVVATPCPLILATPVALIAGVSRAARHGIIVKGGAPLEALARTSVLLLDKTGTITAGRPELLAVESFGALAPEQLLSLAGSLEQLSIHPYAPAILAEARARGLELSFPSAAHEQVGKGISAHVDGREVAIGQLAWVEARAAAGEQNDAEARASAGEQHDAEARARACERNDVTPDAHASPALRSLQLRAEVEGSSAVYIAVDGRLEGALLLQDAIRPEAPRVLEALRRLGVQRIHMVTGDGKELAELVGDTVGVDSVFAERTPEQKLEIVKLLRRDAPIVMVGDGVNDAPALALADVGVAMAARGASAASEAADAVLTGDRLEGLVMAVRVAQRTRRIALQSIWLGMGLSVLAMTAAAFGALPPLTGALLQEAIDVLAILNALRALAGDRKAAGEAPLRRTLARDLSQQHTKLRPRVREIAALAGQLEALSPAAARVELERLLALLELELLPHEREEQRTAYPVLLRLLKPEDPTGPLVRTHGEIQRLVRLYARLLTRVPEAGPRPEDLRELRRTLYGLHAVLSLHFAQEDELYALLDA